MFASYLGHVEIVTMLLDYGVDLALQTVQGQTALSLARDGGRGDIVRMIEDRLALVAVHMAQLEAQQRLQQEEADRAAQAGTTGGGAADVNLNTNAKPNAGAHTNTAATATAIGDSANDKKSVEGAIRPEKKEAPKKTGLFW